LYKDLILLDRFCLVSSPFTLGQLAWSALKITHGLDRARITSLVPRSPWSFSFALSHVRC